MQILETYIVKIDAKGRMALPSGLKRVLGTILDSGFYIRRSMSEKCLEMYTAPQWEAALGRVQSLNPYMRENRSFIRRFMAGVKYLTPDAATRINIPYELSQWAGIEKEVVLSPVGDGMFEMWDKKSYEEVLLRDEEQYAAMAERIMGDNPSHTL